MRNILFILFFFLCVVYAQIPYDVQRIYKPSNPQSVHALPGDKVASDYKYKDTKMEVEKENSKNTLKWLAQKYYKDVDETNKNILEELDQLSDIIGERTLYFTIF
ncbi:hypothetical protein PGSY75_1316300 [Plasmodium gaboni]|uniref:Uncharacterized protein n=1 Tax=Plasmodium gaboni TaxID=647221 RepID=A0A151LDA3_9APIC|nr:hypothetical protein PGSY75_1316300 [Plasmodium gaboni]KYN96964.1 hypothetical protein PGSY75_1316300 [Plasmodium gaboni]SOV17352.1 conserved Plasmodium protein, unknown function [Plasmodium gaboni]SOV24217.1 conserved Plasmodium protein, unknown function [Plasmodium sp. DRC-Itaito]